MLNNIELITKIITGLISIISTIIIISIWLYKRTKKGKIKKFYFLIQDWYDEIDKNLNNNLNLDLLNNKEDKILQFLEDNKLNKTKLKINKK